MELVAAIPIVREAAVAVFRYRTVQPQSIKKGKVHPAQYNIGWGSGFCIVPDRYVVTAFHVLNDRQPRNSTDKFLVFAVPGNGDPAYYFPVTSFPLEKPEFDLAILEIGPSPKGAHLPAIPISSGPQQDGTRVLTLGFPAPEVGGLNIDPQGNYIGGQFFLKSHANEGILSAQYMLGQLQIYEFNVGWHHGESGGPVVTLKDPIGAFTLMQQYRNIKTPHGTVAGPHRGCALSAVQAEIKRLGGQLV